ICAPGRSTPATPRCSARPRSRSTTPGAESHNCAAQPTAADPSRDKGGHMKIAILGSGLVGSTLGGKLAALGHDVKMGARSATNEKAAAFVKEAGPRASQGTFAEAAAFGEVIFNCTSGGGSLPA